MNYYEDIPEDQFVPLECVPENLKDKYEINKLGHIKTKSTGKVRTTFYVDEYGYPSAYLGTRPNMIRLKIHRALAITFIPNPDNKPVVDHINRDRSDFRLSNLRWVSTSENNINKNFNRSEVIFEKYDLNWNFIEAISSNDLSSREKDNISHSIRDNYTHGGFRWKRVDPKLENYISRFGKPKEEDWKECLRCSDYECNRNGMLRKKSDKKLTIGSQSRDGYLKIKIKGTQYSIHRLIYETFSGELLDAESVIDHISTVRDDNRFENLKKCSQSENMLNPVTRINNSKGKVEQYSMEGKILKSYLSIRLAAEELGIKDYTLRSYLRDKRITTLGLFIHEGDKESLNSMLSQVIFKYNSNGELINCYECKKYASLDTTACPESIRKSLESGNLCSDGFYYSRGPRKFD